MVYILYFFLALGTLFLTPWVGDEWLHGTEARRAFLPLLLLVPHVLGRIGQELQLRGRFALAALLDRLLRYAPVYLQAAAFLGLGGFELLQGLWPAGLGELDVAAVEEWHELALGLALLPYFIIQLLVIDARARLFGSGNWMRNARSFQLRLFLSMLVPFLVIGLVSSLFRWNAAWSVRIEEVKLLGGVLGVLFMLGAMLVLPRILTWVWSTQSLPAGKLRARLELLGQRAGLKFRDLMLWRTGGMMPNALIVGFSPGTRRILMTDALVELLSEEELEAVFAHEMGHAKGHHGLLLGAFALGALISSEVLIYELAPRLADSTGWGLQWCSLGLLLAGIGIWARSFGAYSRQLELDADLESLRTTGNLPAIINTLLKVTAPQASRQASWRHPSSATRVAFLLAVASDPSVGERLKKRLGWMRRSALLLFFAAVAFRAWSSVESWDRDWLVSDLRLGHYQEAQARVVAGSEVSEALGALVSTAAGLTAAENQPEQMLALGLVSLQAGDLPLALQLVELCYLRGRRDLEGLLETLDRALEDEPSLERAIPKGWQQALAEALRGRELEPAPRDQ